MLITKFNALIRNRFVWGIFAVLISITMVGFFTDIEGCGATRQSPDTVHMLDGEPISYRALQQAKFNIVLRLRLASGRDFTLTPEMDKLVTREAWKRLAMLQLAGKNGCLATDGEVVAALQRDPMFQANGVFSKDRYSQFLQILAANYEVFPSQFEDYMREELAIDKIRRAVAAGVWTAPYDIERLVRNFADSFTIAYTEIPRATLTRGVTVTEDELRAYYDTHTEAFVIPDKVQVAYVEFPFSDYTASVTVTPESVTNYYGDHINDYFTTNAAGEPLALKLEEVEDQIRGKLADEAGREQAYEAAAQFSDSLYDRSQETNFFYAAAAAAGKKPGLTRFFSERDSLTELGADSDFNRTAFSLTPEKDSNFSEPITASNVVYVIAYEGAQPSRIPPFEEVRDTVQAYALAEARNKALVGKSASVRAAVKDALKAGASFGDAVKAAGFSSPIETEGPFTAYTAPDSLDNARLVTAVISLEQGELSDLIETDRNTLFLALITARTPGETGALDPIRNQIRSSLNRRHAPLFVGQWEDDLLKQKGYQESASSEEEEEEEEEEENGETKTAEGPGYL